MDQPRSIPTVVLVEGDSDKAALEALASQQGHDLTRLSITAMGGAGSIGRFLTDALAGGARVAGLCDAGEEQHVAAAIEGVGLGRIRSRNDLERLGFFVCEPDLEAELIRAVGVETILALIATQGEDERRFRSMQRQPEWRGRSVKDQLRRWFGSGSGRKIRYASLLGATLNGADAPPPLKGLLEYALAFGATDE